MNVQSIGAMRLSTVMSGLFVLLSIPVLIFILAYNYRQNAAAINVTLNDVVANTKQASIGNAENLIKPATRRCRYSRRLRRRIPRFLGRTRAGICSISRSSQRGRSMRPLSASRMAFIVL